MIATRLSVPSQTTKFGEYRTVPTKNQYSSAMKNNPEPQTVQKILYQTDTIPYRTSVFCPVQFS